MTNVTTILVGDLLRNNGSELPGTCERCMLQVHTLTHHWDEIKANVLLPPAFQE